MSAEVVRIGRDAQYEVGGLLVGIVAVKPLDLHDPDDAMMLALTDAALGESVQVILRPGRAREWLGRRVEVVDLQREPVEVELSVVPTEGGPSSTSARSNHHEFTRSTIARDARPRRRWKSRSRRRRHTYLFREGHT